MPDDSPARPSLAMVSSALGYGAIAIAVSVLVGWIAGVHALKAILPGAVSMRVNTALGIGFCGAALALLAVRPAHRATRAFALALAAGAIAIGALTLVEYAFGWDLRIDELIFRDRNSSGPPPGRPATNTAIALIALGTALLLLDVEVKPHPAQALALVAGVIGLLALAGHAYGVTDLYARGAYTRVALNTAVALLLLSVGTFAARPDRGLMPLLTEPGAGGTMVRRLLPWAITVPLTIGFIRLQAQRAGWLDLQAGIAFFALASVITFTVLILWSGRRLMRVDADRRQLLAQSVESQKLESIGRLAGGVAHDFNNLLTAIIGHADFALAEMRPKDPAREDVDEIRQVVDRAMRLTRQLLAFSRRQTVEPSVVDINATVTGMEPMLRRLIGEDIAFTVRLADSPVPAWIDPGQMEQVLLNLVVNARDAMPEGGALTIETGHADLDDAYVARHFGARRGPHVVLAVSDTGTGIPAEVRAHIFEPFFTTKEQGRGSGLGLATCYGVVTQADGDIRVYSAPGHGTTFRVYLPLSAQAEAADATHAPSAAPAHGHETVLLVEDEASVRAIASRALRKLGYTVLEASNGQEALTVAARHNGIALVVTDVVMPVMGGSALVERLRETRPDISVLFTSGYNGDATPAGSHSSPVQLLPKPYTPAQLVTRVREIIDRTPPANGHHTNGDAPGNQS